MSALTINMVNQVKLSPWLHPWSCNFMRFNESTLVYQIFEKVLLHVAITYNLHWKDIWKAKKTEKVAYEGLIVSLLLIDRNLTEYCKLSKEVRIKILGLEKWHILLEYYLS